MTYLGKAETVRADKHSTSIIGGKGKEDIAVHIAKVTKEKKQTKLSHEKKQPH